MMPSAKTALAAGLAVAMLVIAIMAIECTHREKEHRLTKQIEALAEESAEKDAEIEQKNRRIDALNAEIESVNNAAMAIDEIRTETSETKDAIYEAVSGDKDVYDWYVERIPDSVQCILHDRLHSDGENRNEDRVCRSE